MYQTQLMLAKLIVAIILIHPLFLFFFFCTQKHLRNLNIIRVSCCHLQVVSNINNVSHSFTVHTRINRCRCYQGKHQLWKMMEIVDPVKNNLHNITTLIIKLI